MKTVLILGAGASVEAGAPLMADFLPRAKQLYAGGAYGSDAQQVQDVLTAAYKDLKPIQVKSRLNYKNIEELFSAVDIGQLIRCFGARPAERIDELGGSIVTFISRTLEETVRIPRLDKGVGAPKGYDALAGLLQKKVAQSARSGRQDVSFITFNYDTLLEFSLVRKGLGVDYGLREPFLNEDETRYPVNIPVLKLHGSINWAVCPKCNSIVPTEIDPYRRSWFVNLVDLPPEVKLQYGAKLQESRHSCGSPLAKRPFLVPPTWNKASSASSDLRGVWQRAALELGAAENVIVIGYSLPWSDTFFKYLFALGTNSDAHLEKFVVINGPQGGETEERFKALLGPMTSDAFQFYPFVFSGGTHIIKQVLEL